jgi:hypothetical protein
MAHHTFVHFEHDEAAALARLQSIHFDLSSATRLCEYFESQSGNGYPPSEVTDAFSTAILVRYSRAFVPGVRRGLEDEAMASLSAEQRASHERLRHIRDKHIAHSVNAFEDTKVQARYCLERVQEEGITAVSAAHYRVIGLSSEDIQGIKDLCGAFLLYVNAKIADEKQRLLSVLRSMPLEEVLARPSSPVLGAAKARVDKRRHRP